MEEVTAVPEEEERSASYKPVFVTEITDDLHFYVQDVETGERSGPAPGRAASGAPPFSGREERTQPGGSRGRPGIVDGYCPPQAQDTALIS